MDTKSKNISHSKTLKVIVAIIALLAFFVSGYSAWAFVESFALYNGFDENVDYFQTNVFGTLMNSEEYNILSVDEYLTVKTKEDFMKTTSGKWLSEELKTVDTIYDALEKNKVQIYVDEEERYRYSASVDGEIYYFNYNGDLLDEDTFVEYLNGGDYSVVKYDDTSAVVDDTGATAVTVVVDTLGRTIPGVPNAVNEIRNALSKFNEYSYSYGYESNFCYGEVSRDELKSKMYKNSLHSIGNGVFTENADGTLNFELYETVDPGFYYAVKVKSTGKVISNCGITDGDSYETALAKMKEKGLEFIESMEGENASSSRVKDSKPESLLEEYSQKLFNTVPNWADYNLNYSASYMVFACDTTAEDSGFAVSREAFEKYENKALKNPTTALAVFAVSFLVGCAACLYLLSVTGKTADGETKIYPLDRLPLLIHLAFNAALSFCGCLAAVFIFETHFESAYSYSNLSLLMMKTLYALSRPASGLAVALAFLPISVLLGVIIRNIRNRSFIRHTLIYWIIKPVVFICKKIAARLKFIFVCDYAKGKGKKLRYISFVVVCAFFLLNLFPCIFCIGRGWNAFGLLCILLNFLAAAVMFVLISSLDKIMHAVADTRSGNINVIINTALMPQFMRDFANDINRMQDGLKNAVENAVKDQRMKAELITNVSHDLKTPLTSIVNYVDLLKRCEVENEDAKKYIDILDEKSQRMKKLIEDLVEASKASSGAVELHPTKINLCEFAAQAVGEHEDELRNKNIELVLKLHTQPVMIFADAQKTSRIVENLFSNIRKYALEGTRVYIDVNGGANYGTITLRNISKYPLDIAPEELTQRFVRGDASRTGEGSGLGLSIANDLCELQSGKFSIAIDGDLFKVSVAMPTAK